jgi:superfamily I DNA/RNA helicase
VTILITDAKLRAAGACEGQRKTFAKLYPKGCTVTTRSVTRCAKAGLYVDWFADAFLSDNARDEYKRQCAPLWAEYERQCATLWAEYDRQCATFRDEYERQCAPLWAEYDRQCATLWAEYDRQCDPLLVKAWNRGRGAK